MSPPEVMNERIFLKAMPTGKTNNQRRRIDGFAAMLNAYVVMENHLEDYTNMI